MCKLAPYKCGFSCFSAFKVFKETADMEEVVVMETDCRAELTRGHSFHSFSIRSSSESAQVNPITTSPPCGGEEDGTNWRGPGGGGELNPLDAWLPITESRNGNTFSVTFHLLCSGIGFQALLLPFAFVTLGWAWGIICLSLAFTWQLYTIWLLVQLHESESGIRYSRYIHLAVTAFGPKLGKLLGMFPVMYLSGGTCVQLIIIGGSTIKLFFNTVCDAKSVTATECFLMFTCLAMAGAQFRNLNSMARVSFIGTITAIVYCTLIWALSIAKGRHDDISYDPPLLESNVDRFGGILNALGIIFLAFRGHNVILEIQGTLPSKHPTRKPMWRGVIISYAVIAMCLLPLAVCGFWAYGNKVPSSIGEILIAAAQFGGHKTSKFVLGLICILVVVSCLSAFQIYGMVVFDNLELRYSSKKTKPCARWLRVAFRIFFGVFVFFIAMAFPFLISLAVLIGGLAFPLTYAHPCLMWIAIKKPKRKGVIWCINMGLGCLGLSLSVLLVVAASWNIAHNGLNANFFRP
ncbi:putative amino acid transporter, transmembrane domain-containing protein [Rosa chinensis]|uniref:Putative amino acid transporter, transmembrane domain-containing protein n=2 Tax=Rosa chinensis TaxID=74649 RepID=A0A2P6PT32_ROSCH|nr:putative amino acid transporter, transmembrane domain-containing protein [Rosa chinensis]